MFDQVWQRVLDKHYDPTLGCLDWPALRQEFGSRLPGVRDVAAAVELTQQMLDSLEQSHFDVMAPGGRNEHAGAGPGTPGIAARWIDGQAVVVEGSRAVPTGSVLVSIAGQDVAGLVARVGPSLRRPEELGFRMRFAMRRALSCQPGSTVAIVAGLPNAGQVQRSLACTLPEGELVTLGNLRDVPTRVEHRMIAGTNTGYLAFNIWMLPMVERVRAALATMRAAGMRALVLDLRGNPGGVGPMSLPVARMLLPGGGNLGKMQFREFEQQFTVTAEPDPFTGPIAVLIDEGTASTSEIFAAGMRDLGRVTVFGSSPSAGAALPSIIEELEGGVILQYVVGDYHSPAGTVVEGRGVVPDVIVPETLADFIAGRDPVLEAATAALAKEKPR